MMTNKLILGALLSVLFLSSCSNDEIVNETVIPLGKYEKGIIVLNEGGFQKGNSSVSYISSDLSVAENDVFSNVNKDKGIKEAGVSLQTVEYLNTSLCNVQEDTFCSNTLSRDFYAYTTYQDEHFIVFSIPTNGLKRK